MAILQNMLPSTPQKPASNNINNLFLSISSKLSLQLTAPNNWSQNIQTQEQCPALTSALQQCIDPQYIYIYTYTDIDATVPVLKMFCWLFIILLLVGVYLTHSKDLKFLATVHPTYFSAYLLCFMYLHIVLNAF